MAFILAASLSAEPVAVHYIEGTVHGFLVLRTLAGKTLASGDLIQIIHGERVTSRATFRFKDGSIDDETAVFSQRAYFKLLSDHHIQKGPAFPHPMDLSVNVESGEVTVRYRDKGHEQVDKQHLDIPPDLANGMILDVLKNISATARETTISYLATTPKPRLVKLLISPHGEESFSVAGANQKAVLFTAKIELGGLEGVLAPLVGKQPPDIKIWLVCGEAPAFVKMEGPLYLGGPSWSIEMTAPVWPDSHHSIR